jgi:hypothetical protein
MNSKKEKEVKIMTEELNPRVILSEIVWSDGNVIMHVIAAPTSIGRMTATVLVGGYPITFMDDSYELTPLVDLDADQFSESVTNLVIFYAHIGVIRKDVVIRWLANQEERSLQDILDDNDNQGYEWFAFSETLATILHQAYPQAMPKPEGV